MFSVATANTQEARLLQGPDGLRPFYDRAIDILLLQEVLGLENGVAEERLRSGGYELVHHIGAMGLSIARHMDSSSVANIGAAAVTTVDAPRESHVLRHIPALTMRMRPRGMLAAPVRLASGFEVTAVTSHPIACTRPFVRMRQIQDETDILRTEFPDVPLLFGKDANHYPRPHGIDDDLMGINGLRRVALSEPTWRIAGSRHEWITKIPFGKRLVKDAVLDTMLFRGITLNSSEVIDMQSDHRAIIGWFTEIDEDESNGLT